MTSSNNQIRLLDGAMGTELMRVGLDLPLPIWSGDINLTHPDYVRKIHKAYLTGGADILTTNTFRTTPRAYRNNRYAEHEARLRSHESLEMAVKLARQAAGDGIIVAGSIAPLEDCYEPELFPGVEFAQREFRELAIWLQDAGVDALLFETMGCWPEIKTALSVTGDLQIPRWLSLILQNGNALLDGTDLTNVLPDIKDYGIEMVLLNCNLCSITAQAVDVLLTNWKGLWGVYPNVGAAMPTKEGVIEEKLTIEEFANEINKYLTSGANVVGACCGSNPDYISAARKAIDLATEN
ncbi:MAG TPA: homocysteine S-methyltransferase family protein [Candidatus Marinimicrobia bacterium]|jgi:homocysteine S-methyltransferase|nr:homocysteine S-methyltransferase family protein [Candidatus Neomarinimicrobiota bacterium]